MFDSREQAGRAEAEYGYPMKTAGAVAEAYIRGESGGMRRMDAAQSAAYFDVSGMRILLSEAKELIYWALDMGKTFVPRLAAAHKQGREVCVGPYFKTEDGVCLCANHHAMYDRGLIEIDFNKGTATTCDARAEREAGWQAFVEQYGKRIIVPCD